jgi:hypothetical protein
MWNDTVCGFYACSKQYPKGIEECQVQHFEVALKLRPMNNPAGEDMEHHERCVAHSSTQVEREAIPSTEH